MYIYLYIYIYIHKFLCICLSVLSVCLHDPNLILYFSVFCYYRNNHRLSCTLTMYLNASEVVDVL